MTPPIIWAFEDSTRATLYRLVLGPAAKTNCRILPLPPKTPIFLPFAPKTPIFYYLFCWLMNLHDLTMLAKTTEHNHNSRGCLHKWIFSEAVFGIFCAIVTIVLPKKEYLLKQLIVLCNFHLYLVLDCMRELPSYGSECLATLAMEEVSTCIYVHDCICVCIYDCICVCTRRRVANGSECLAALAMEELCICLSPLFTCNLLLPGDGDGWWWRVFVFVFVFV